MSSIPSAVRHQDVRQARLSLLRQQIQCQLLIKPERCWSEHELLNALSEASPDQDWLAQRDGLGLFQLHFLVFHALYALRDRWRMDKERDLEISALSIRVLPWHPGKAGLAQADPLADYYRDLTQLDAMNEEGLRALLDGFWKGMPLADKREQALETLGLNDPVDEPTIRQRYRQLAMKHHPDRGGNTERLQAVHHAMKQLGLR
jgi:DnaJ-domain-containing protein 1